MTKGLGTLGTARGLFLCMQGIILIHEALCFVPEGPKYQNVGICCLYTRNRKTEFGNVLCIWVLGPLGRSLLRV